MAVNNNFPQAPEKVTLDVPTLRLIIRAINSIVKGKTNNTGDLTLTANAGSTTINNPLCNVNSVILLQPITAHAATAYATTWPISGDKTFTLTHANNAQIDRNFKYVIIG